MDSAGEAGAPAEGEGSRGDVIESMVMKVMGDLGQKRSVVMKDLGRETAW